MLPPFTGEAVKVTGYPLHDVAVTGVMLTEGAAAEVILMVTLLLVADDVVVHAALLVRTTDTTSLSAKVEVVKFTAVCPLIELPFNSH